VDAWLEVDGARLRYRDDGAGHPLLCIHGWALDLDVWEPQVATLSSRYRLLRFDRRGYGLSTGAPSLDADVRDAIALLDHLRVGSAALIGASHGARVALRLGLSAPGRFTGVVLDGPPDEVGRGRGALTDEVPLAQYRALARGGDLAAVRRLWSSHPFTQLATRDPTTQALLAAMLARYPGNDLLQASSAAPSLVTNLRALVLPILVLNGEHDLASRRAAGAALAAALPNAARRVIAGAAHLSNLDNPSAYALAVQQFLTQCLSAWTPSPRTP
jgi:pimeloyl-ACP methyl ester carboxylesterase